MVLNLPFPVEVIRTPRKYSTSIQIINGKVRVRVPKNLANHQIEKLITKRSAWIRENLRLHAEMTPHNQKEYVNGEKFAYLGRNYSLKIDSTDSNGEVKLKTGCLQVLIPQHHIGDKKTAVLGYLEHWYRQKAWQRLTEKTQIYVKKLQVQPKSVQVRSYKARWGSCSVAGDISYNWRIIMAPQRIVDYVVVHELCHILEHNHSPRFWQHVENQMPDFREHKEWLKQNSMALVI